MGREGDLFLQPLPWCGLPQVPQGTTDQGAAETSGFEVEEKTKNILKCSKPLLHTCNCPVLWSGEHGVFLGFLRRQRLHTRLLIVLNSHCFLGFSPLVSVSSGI